MTATIANSAESDLCPGVSLKIEDFQPKRLQAWINQNTDVLKSPKDFLCCVPEEVRKRFVIAHTSIAAQNGDANNPRVIFFHKSKRDNHNPDDNSLHFAFSINSGRSHLSNHNGVEFVYANQETGDLSYFDVEISQNHKGFIGGKNPEKCMACHGTSSRFGPKPILTDRPWHNFVSGHNFRIQTADSERTCDPVPKEFVRKLDLNAMDALIADASDSRLNFSCLDLKSLKSDRKNIATGEVPLSPALFSTLIEFDNTFRHNHRNRVWKDLKNHFGYDKYKYLMVGASLCEDIRLRDWVPRPVLLEGLSDIDYHNYQFGEVNSRGRYKMSLGGVIQYSHSKIRTEYREFKERQDAFDTLLQNPSAMQDFFANSSSRLFFGANPAACFEKNYQYLVNVTLQKYGIRSQYMTRIELDNVLSKESSNKGNHPILRFIFEGLLKFPSIDLNMSLYNGVSSNSLDFKGMPILSHESVNSELSGLFSEEDINFGGLSNDFAMTVSKFHKKKTPFLVETATWKQKQSSFQTRRVFGSKFDQRQLCQQLEKLSRTSFEGWPNK